jgi:hypothetical protein
LVSSRSADADQADRCPADRGLRRNTQDLPTLALAGQLPPRRALALRLKVVTKR